MYTILGIKVGSLDSLPIEICQVLLSFATLGNHTFAAVGSLDSLPIEICQVLLSFATLGNHTFAAVGTGESYEALSTAFLVNGIQYELDIYLGGDYKVICVNYLCTPMHYLLTNFQYFQPSSSCQFLD